MTFRNVRNLGNKAKAGQLGHTAWAHVQLLSATEENPIPSWEWGECSRVMEYL